MGGPEWAEESRWRRLLIAAETERTRHRHATESEAIADRRDRNVIVELRITVKDQVISGT
jgi:hypothetical protein